MFTQIPQPLTQALVLLFHQLPVFAAFAKRGGSKAELVLEFADSDQGPLELSILTSILGHERELLLEVVDMFVGANQLGLEGASLILRLIDGILPQGHYVCCPAIARLILTDRIAWHGGHWFATAQLLQVLP